jgi:TonB family protein
MSMPAVALYREYDLPWTPSQEDERRLRRVLGAVLGLFVAFGIVIPLLPEMPKAAAPPEIPQRVVEFLLEPPRPKPEPTVEPRPEPVTERPVPVEPREARVPVVEPVPRTQPQPQADPKQKAASSGLLALSQQLTELRQRDVDTRVDAKALDPGAGAKARVDRALLTAKVGEGSGGIAVAAASSGFGAGSTGLKGHDTAKVAAPPSAVPSAAQAERSGQSHKGARTREEVELVFDRNKAAIHALYSRALRDNPALQGKVVLEVTIAPSGEVTACRVVSSELGDPELERKLVARVRMFRFEERDVATMTTTKPIEFFPA